MKFDKFNFHYKFDFIPSISLLILLNLLSTAPSFSSEISAANFPHII